MAKIPEQKEVEQTIKQNEIAHANKLADQQKQGKDFVVPEDGHGPGVIPEKIWKNLPGKKEQA